jgi:pimeloyl-ACP methyl ester carboxylesterase
MRSFCFWIAALISLGTVQAAEPISVRDAKIDNVQLHYLTAGQGPAAVILLHGFAETSRMWRPIIPTLAEKFTVIAPDLPGIGDSSIPDKIDMLEAAKKIHALVRSLKIDKARVVGHDIGLMVAYA